MNDALIIIAPARKDSANQQEDGNTKRIEVPIQLRNEALFASLGAIAEPRISKAAIEMSES